MLKDPRSLDESPEPLIISRILGQILRIVVPEDGEMGYGKVWVYREVDGKYVYRSLSDQEGIWPPSRSQAGLGQLLSILNVFVV